MPITVQHAPPLSGISQVAQDYGSNMENQRQQQLALNLEGLAQRERMQSADLGFRDRAMQFQAATNRQNLLTQLASRQQQQSQALQAEQQSLAFQQQGRERMALFGAQQDQLGRAQNFQMQQALQQQEWGNRSQYAREQMNLEGQARMREFDRQRDALREAANRYGFSPEQLTHGMQQIDLREAGVDYSQFEVHEPSMEEIISQRTFMDPSGSGYWIQQPSGELKFQVMPEARESRVLKLPESLGGGEFRPGETTTLPNGTVLQATDSKWEVLQEAPEPVSQEGPIRENDRIRWIQQQAQYYMNQVQKQFNQNTGALIGETRMDRDEAWQLASNDYQGMFGNVDQEQDPSQYSLTDRFPSSTTIDGVGLREILTAPEVGWDAGADFINKAELWINELSQGAPEYMQQQFQEVGLAVDRLKLAKVGGKNWDDMTSAEKAVLNKAMDEVHYFYRYTIEPYRAHNEPARAN